MLPKYRLIASCIRVVIVLCWLSLAYFLLSSLFDNCSGCIKHRPSFKFSQPSGSGEAKGKPWESALLLLSENQGEILPFFFGEPPLGTSPKHRVALLTQLSVDRLDSLVSLAAVWQSRISAAVFVRTLDELRALQRGYHAEPLLSGLVSVHVLIGRSDEKYPVNQLRNIALQHVQQAEFVLMVDVDFICNPGMSGELNALAARLWDSGNYPSDDRLTAVVPAFEVLEGIEMPRDKETMRSLYYAMQAFQVHYFKGVHAHQVTDYARWMETPQAIEYEIFYDYLYEPYVLLRREECPWYDENFIGYGNDKASHAYELQAARFRFLVAPDSFIIHRDHGEPAWRADQSSSESWETWWNFVRQIREEYPSFQQIIPAWLYASCLAGDCPLFWEWDDLI